MIKERWYKNKKPLPYGYRPVLTTNVSLNDIGEMRRQLHDWINSSDDRQRRITNNARQEMKIFIEVTEDHSDELKPYR